MQNIIRRKYAFSPGIVILSISLWCELFTQLQSIVSLIWRQWPFYIHKIPFKTVISFVLKYNMIAERHYRSDVKTDLGKSVPREILRDAILKNKSLENTNPGK